MTTTRAAGRQFAEVAIWWAITFGVWLATVSTVSGQELFVAAVCTLGCAIPARSMRHANQGDWRPRPGWALWMPSVLAALVPDTLRVWRFGLTRGRRGAVDEQLRLDLPKERKAVAAARRAIAVFALGATPGTVVIDSFAEPNRLVVHRVGTSKSRLDDRVQR